MSINVVSPNVVVDWLRFMFRIREVPGPSLGPETGYPNRGYRGILQTLQANCGWYLNLGHYRFLPNSLQFH
jgi:hypothetical protein